MKELSIEEKAKAYDEAKLRMSAAYNSNRCTISFMNEIFPELKESEDERIRKSINRLIRYYHDVNFPTPEGLSRKDLLDWIEKRGEQESANWLQELEDKLANATPKQLAEWKEKYFKEEPTEWSREDEINRGLLYNALNKVYDIEHNVALSNWINKRILLSSKQEWSEEDKMQLDAAIHLVSSTGHIETTNWLRALKNRVLFQEKQGEQKSAEVRTTGYWNVQDIEQKSADSKIIDLDELVIELEETIGTSPHSRETIKDFFQKAVQKYMKCLQITNGEIGRLMDENYYLREEQKPAEWSEEDEKRLNNAIIQLKAASHIIFEDEVNDSIAFIKSLKDRVQPKQKWSEEDERIRQDIEDLIHFSLEDGSAVSPAANTTKEKAISWIQFLKDRYTWKPSGRQMSVLEYYMHTLACNEHKEILFGLYQDLKKLKG